jgi:hypothetical protein
MMNIRNLVSYPKGEHRLREFENSVLRRIFGPNKEVVTAGCMKIGLC